MFQATCTYFRPVLNPLSSPQDFAQHCTLADQLLFHFQQQYKDRETYYVARERARCQRDILTMAIDSYDKAKVLLPRFPHGGRNPKKRAYEKSRRPLAQ